MSQIMAEPSQHHTDLIHLVSTARLLQHEVVNELPGQVHHTQAVLPPGVLGSGVHIVGTAKLSQTTQPRDNWMNNKWSKPNPNSNSMQLVCGWRQWVSLVLCLRLVEAEFG